NGNQTPLNRTGLLKATVIPRVLSAKTPQPFSISCAVDSLYQRVLTINDTGAFPIAITGVNCLDDGFTTQYTGTLPDTITPGSTRNIIVKLNKVSGSLSVDTFCVVNILAGNRVIIADTIYINVHPEAAAFAITRNSLGSVVANSENIGIQSISDLGRLGLTALDLELQIDPPDVAVVDTENVKVDNSIFPDATVTAGFDQLTGKYFARIVSSTFLPSSASASFLQVPIKYFVAKDSSAELLVRLRSPEKDGCVNFADAGITIVSTQNCGDPEIRNLLGNRPLISDVSVSPNPVFGNHAIASFTSAEKLSLSAEVTDIYGRMILRTPYSEFEKGSNTLALELPIYVSGAYSVRLTGRTSGGQMQEKVSKIIIAH
ncbi:MAG: hypothetical protein ABI778_08670, partial [Ignavibacteriota bacterium]